MFYSLFVLRISYKIYNIIVISFIFSKLSGPRAYPSLARAGPGPNIHGLGRAWA